MFVSDPSDWGTPVRWSSDWETEYETVTEPKFLPYANRFGVLDSEELNDKNEPWYAWYDSYGSPPAVFLNDRRFDREMSLMLRMRLRPVPGHVFDLVMEHGAPCPLFPSPSPRVRTRTRSPSSA